jgi:hypothetical protein
VKQRLMTWAMFWGQFCLPLAAVYSASRGLYGIAIALVFASLHVWRAVLRDSTNLVMGVGPLFWIWRDGSLPAKAIGISRLRETDEPWRRGVGVHARFGQHWLLIGVCRRTHPEHGLLDVLDGHELDAEPGEIASWH